MPGLVVPQSQNKEGAQSQQQQQQQQSDKKNDLNQDQQCIETEASQQRLENEQKEQQENDIENGNLKHEQQQQKQLPIEEKEEMQSIHITKSEAGNDDDKEEQQVPVKEDLQQQSKSKQEEQHKQHMEKEKIEEISIEEQTQLSSSNSNETQQQQQTTTAPKSAPIKNASQIINEYITLYQKIESLENQIQQCTITKRRRICNLFDIHPLYRRSHLRLFINHQLLQESLLQEDGVTTTHRHQWKLMLEGSLLVGYDENNKKLIAASSNMSNVTALSSTDNVEDDNNDNVDDEFQNENLTTKQQQHISSTSKKPIIFTHFFEKIEITFRPYPPSPTKKTSTSSKRRKLNDVTSTSELDSKHTTKLVWTRSEGGTNRPTPDAHAFHATYNDTTTIKKGSPPIIADILLYRHLYTDLDLYQPSQSFMNLLLPKYYSDDERITELSSSTIQKKHTHHIPCTFTFKEIVMIIYTYIQIHNLQDPSDQSIINNDRVFVELFGCQLLQFSSLKHLLFERKLVTKLEDYDDYDVPIHIQYIMNGTVDDESCSSTNSPKQQPNSYSFDMDIYLPSPFHTQIREILLRIKNRELAYTSSRTKAVKLLASARGDEDKIKQLMEEIIHHSDCTPITSTLSQRKNVSSQHVPILLALEKSSADGSEAKMGVGIDVKLVYLMEKLLERCDRLECCWEVMEGALAVS